MSTVFSLKGNPSKSKQSGGFGILVFENTVQPSTDGTVHRAGVGEVSYWVYAKSKGTGETPEQGHTDPWPRGLKQGSASFPVKGNSSFISDLTLHPW